MALQRKQPGDSPYGEEPLEQPFGPPTRLPYPSGSYSPGKVLSPSEMPKHEGEHSETPRERMPEPSVDRMGPRPVPSRPSVPTPMAGSTMELPSTEGILPFTPLAGPDAVSQASPVRRSLYGGQRGLTGGGLGVPLDPVSNDQSDPISSLIAMLLKNQQGGY